MAPHIVGPDGGNVLVLRVEGTTGGETFTWEVCTPEGTMRGVGNPITLNQRGMGSYEAVVSILGVNGEHQEATKSFFIGPDFGEGPAAIAGDNFNLIAGGLIGLAILAVVLRKA